jgi:signal transduction histidine kinase
MVTRRALLTLLVGVGSAAFGIAAEAVRFSWGDPGHWGPDLTVGWALVGCGLLARSRPSGTSVLMVGAGFTWFLGNFAAADWPVLAWIATQTVYLHRGLLIHAVLAFPGVRPRTAASSSMVLIGYATSLVGTLARDDVAVTALGVAVVAVAAWELRTTSGPARRIQVIVLRTAAALGFALAGSGLVRLVSPQASTWPAVLPSYQAMLVALATGLLVALRTASWERMPVTDLIVELTARPAGAVGDALAQTLGDPTIQVGYWVAERGGYVDATGRPIEVPGPGSNRAVAPIDREGARIAVLIHDPALTTDARLVTAISAAAALAASNARLQAQVRDRVAQVQASRRRLVEAGAEERRRLELRMRDGAGRRLEGLAAVLTAADELATASNQPELRAKLDRARLQLESALEEMAELARGLYPPSLTERGLAAALSELCGRSAVPVELAVSVPGLPTQIAAVAYFVCAEALSNVAKYAEASTVSVSARVPDGRLVIEVTDDGIGGADPARGSGLRGLADRVEALAGSLRTDSPAGAGTRLTAEIPLGGQPQR